MSNVNFTSGAIRVTDSAAVFGSVTYQISSIGSVSIKQDPGGFGTALMFADIVFSIYIWITISFLFGIVIFFGLGFAIAMIPSKSTLVFRTSSGDVHVFSSYDKALIAQIKGAIEQAFANRGSLQ
ncbi:hypothetical protein FJ417_00280 [Mesorhizobium sp. B3-1-7]|uniref:DUF6232 family protein n=1 Tax=Mesorhizobium sp. B3-1-7 TaxID=2589894 RepID=UPI00112AB056|nr:DUF6232 family protein [Mesorhizobium sp. B3-1-7]TPI65052.1 hypothetical protein FJ417_00280 [Mesorhizobium sp. B3-1-7]